jgi:hypothetical protein
MRSSLWAAILLAAAALAGCGGLSDPYNDVSATGTGTTTTTPAFPEPGGGTATDAAAVPDPTGTTTTPVAIEEGIGSSAPDLPDDVDRSVLSTSAAATIERYVDLSGNWTWEDVVERMRQAARISMGQAREAMLVSAVQIPADTTYQTRGIRQTTRIEAIVPRAGATDEQASYLVVQRRRIEMIDATPSNQWFVSLARLTSVDGRWVVSVWEELV